jgi:LmbE family N-acetylglucosaminyl deacetylase
VELIVDENHLGWSEALWEDSGHHLALTHLELSNQRIVIVAPHPDDEVLGAGGLIQAALSRDMSVRVVAVTDGERSHPHSTKASDFEFAAVRSRESRLALSRLGWDEARITHLHIPDGTVARRRAHLDFSLAKILRPGDLCVAPWRHDGHPDHDACGQSSLDVSRAIGATALGYLVWAWHWADPHGSDIPWGDCQRLDLSRAARARKRWATGAFQSQTHSIGPDVADAPVLPAPIMRRFWRNYEVYVDQMACSP